MISKIIPLLLQMITNISLNEVDIKKAVEMKCTTTLPYPFLTLIAGLHLRYFLRRSYRSISLSHSMIH